MLQISVFNVDKFVHLFVTNLGFKIESPARKYSNKIALIAHVHRVVKLRHELLCIAEKIKDVALEQNCNLSDEKSVQCFLEKRTNFLDKSAYLNYTQFTTSYLKNINKKIVQKVRVKKATMDNSRKMETKVSNKNELWNRKIRAHNHNNSPLHKGNHVYSGSFDRKKNKKPIMHKNSKVLPYNPTMFKCNKFIKTLPEQQGSSKCNTTNNLINDGTCHIKKEIEIAGKFLRLCIKDMELLRRNLHITLYINKDQSHRVCLTNKAYRNHVISLCQCAILCTIEPSRRALVTLKDNLTTLIEQYLSRGFEYHFDFQRKSKDSYSALLILSHWAKPLVKYLDTVMIRTISGILKCSTKRILVLSYPEDKS